jgi:DNA-binding CsgD family transcriptional regulator
MAQHVFSGIASGWIDSCQGRARWRLATGEELDVVMWVRPLHVSDPAGPTLLAVAPAGAGTPIEPATVAPDSAWVSLGVIDHELRIVDLGLDAREMFGWRLDDHLGAPLLATVHPADLPHVLLALARSSTDGRGILTRLRVRGNGQWIAVRCKVARLHHREPPRFAFAMWAIGSEEAVESTGDRIARLEDHLWRIALEVHATGITGLPTADARSTHPALRELSERQREILRRLLRGERVPAMARELFLSESTVRNHLSAIYRRLGVHSQQELLAHLTDT